MKFFDKLKRFIRRIFIDYNSINKMIEESSRKAIEETSKKTIEELSKKIIEEGSQQNSKIIYELNKNNKAIETIENKVDNLTHELLQSKSSVEQIKNNMYDINMSLNKLKYYNTELQNIKIDKSKKNILLVGFYGAPNLGDELMLETMLDYLEDVQNKKITVLLSDNPEYSIDKYKDISFLHYPNNLCDFNILAEKFDYIIFGGGAIIDDKKYLKEKAYQSDLGTILIKLAIRAIAFNKKVICIGLSSSTEISNQEYIEKLKYIVKNSYFFSVRDAYTKKFLEKKLGEDVKNKIVEIYDIVFSNNHILDNILKQHVKREKMNIGIVSISNDNNLEKLKFIIQGIKQYNKDAIINLIPFYDYYSIDTNFYNRIKEENDTKINIEEYPEDMQKTIELYQKNDIIIGMRYHSILLAYALNIPCISICYDIHEHYPNKIKFLNEQFNKDQAISYIEMRKEDIYQRLKKLDTSEKETNLSEQIVKKAQSQMKDIIEKLFNE